MTETTIVGQAAAGHFLTSPSPVSYCAGRALPSHAHPALSTVSSFATTLEGGNAGVPRRRRGLSSRGFQFPSRLSNPSVCFLRWPLAPQSLQLGAPCDPTWGLSSPHSVSSLRANNSQPDLALRASNVTGPQGNSPSPRSLPPRSIFPSVVCILVNGRHLHPPSCSCW